MAYDKQIVIDVALSQVGYREKASNASLDNNTANPGDSNWTKYARDLDKLGNFYNGPKNGYAWCDVFVDWCFVTAYGRSIAQMLLCQPNGSAGAGCQYSAEYYSKKGQFHKNSPRTGDQIFFGSAWNNIWHTGLVVDLTDTYVITVEGNSGDSVRKCTYRLSDPNIFGYGRPDYGEQPNNSGSSSTVVVVPVTPVKTVRMCSPKIPILSKNDESGFVRAAQILLGERGFYCGGKVDPVTKKEEYDGEFGPSTEKSVKEFQQKSKLTADGIVGAATWAALLDL